MSECDDAQLSEYERCKAKLLRLVSVSERCEHDVRVRLAREGFDGDTVDRVIEHALSLKLIDDERFAGMYVRSKLLSGWGRARIERELASRGIVLSLLPGYPEEFYGDEDEMERARAFAQNFHSSAKNKRDALYRKLLNKGFSIDVASRICAESFPY